MALRYQALRGTRDILPDEVPRWQRLESATREVFSRYGFGEIRTPVFEATELFTRSVGVSTDIVRKEMYTFAAGEESLTLRPEATAPVVRAVIEHSLHRGIAAGYPERLFYIGPMFRHERPQKGRQRQFHQIGAEVLGAPEPLADAETIEMVWSLLDELGIEGRELRLSSVGDADTRAAYRAALTSWLSPHLPGMCDDCRRRASRIRCASSTARSTRTSRSSRGLRRSSTTLAGMPPSIFAAVRALLDGYGIPYVLDPRLVRGLDYYVRTVFEIAGVGLGRRTPSSAVDGTTGWSRSWVGPRCPGSDSPRGWSGWSSRCRRGGARDGSPDLALVALGDAGFSRIDPDGAPVRPRVLAVLAPLSARPLGAQIKRAEKAGARFAAFVGESELARGLRVQGPRLGGAGRHGRGRDRRQGAGGEGG